MNCGWFGTDEHKQELHAIAPIQNGSLIWQQQKHLCLNKQTRLASDGSITTSVLAVLRHCKMLASISEQQPCNHSQRLIQPPTVSPTACAMGCRSCQAFSPTRSKPRTGHSSQQARRSKPAQRRQTQTNNHQVLTHPTNRKTAHDRHNHHQFDDNHFGYCHSQTQRDMEMKTNKPNIINYATQYQLMRLSEHLMPLMPEAILDRFSAVLTPRMDIAEQHPQHFHPDRFDLVVDWGCTIHKAIRRKVSQ